MTEESDWFECTECGESDNLSVKKVLGLGNFSVNIDCGGCNHRHVERDPSSENWNKPISIKHRITGRNIRSPKGSRNIHKMLSCPLCGSSDVEFWIYSDNEGLGSGETVGHLRFDCKSCPEIEESSISHS